MASGDPAPSLLLALPEPCLLAVLQCCAVDDQRSLFSAAMAHSRLHQAAVLALRSITAVVTSQQQADGVLLYLSKHGWCFDSVSIAFDDAVLPPSDEDPPEMFYPSVSLCLPAKGATQLCSLQLRKVQLLVPQMGDVSHGALGTSLKQLQLSECTLCDDAAGAALAAALSHLQGLEHLSLRYLGHYKLPTCILQQQQQLTHLELAWVKLVSPDDEDRPWYMVGSLALQPLQSLTRLADLRVMEAYGSPVSDALGDCCRKVRVSHSMLSGMRYLTRLQLQECLAEPDVLAGRTPLQHLLLTIGGLTCGSGAETEAAQVLSHLQQLQQLTHLQLTFSYHLRLADNLPAAALSAMTASSKLQHLDISKSTLPAGVWRHVFPTGRQLPHLRSLNISWAVEERSRKYALAPEGSRLVSCCPGLQSLNMQGLLYSAALLAPLQGLSELTALQVTLMLSPEQQTLDFLCQLTRLRELGLGDVSWDRKARGLFSRLMQLTQLKQLTSLTWLQGHCLALGWGPPSSLTSQAPGDEPVWRQLLWRHLDSSDPDVAQQAAAGLAE